MPESKWRDVKDADVLIVWVCDNADCLGTVEDRTCAVNPSWHEENGTPTCSCGSDMVYLKTQIRGKK